MEKTGCELLLKKQIMRIALYCLVLAALLFCIWQIAYKISFRIAWVSIRKETLNNYNETRAKLKQNYGQPLSFQEVTGEEASDTRHKLIFYYFVVPADTNARASYNKLYSSITFIEYQLERINCSFADCAIVLCGQNDIINKLNLMPAEETFNYVRKVAITGSIYAKLSLQPNMPTVIITDQSNRVVWCSVYRPSNDLLFQLVDKFTST